MLTVSPSITVVLPVYNGARYLHSCLLSIQNQTHENYELLIGDDGSTDETPAIVASFSDLRWHYIRHEKNLGLFGNLNRLVEAAQAPLVRILCQDDLLEPDCLAAEVDFFAAHPDVGMFFCKYHIIDDAGNLCGHSPIHDLPVVMPPRVSMQYFYYYGCLPGNLSTACINRAAFTQVGLFDESFRVAADFEMWLRICAQADLGVLHRYLIKLRNHPQQLSRAHASYQAHILETRRLRAAILPQLPPEIRSAASRYTLMRQNVFDTHYALRALIMGWPGVSARIMRAMGPRDLAWGLFYWLVSGNNRFFRPKPPFTADAIRL